MAAPLAGVSGWWDPDRRTIWVDPGLSQAERRSTIAHELVHAERGDESCAAVSDWHEQKQERAVDQEAARRLITLEQLVDALLWTRDLGELAEELWVDVETLRTRLAHLHPAEKHYVRRRLAAVEHTA